MLRWFDHLRQRHRFLAQQALYPVLLSTMLACGLFAGRVYLMERLDKGQTIFPEVSTSLRWQKLEKPVKLGALRVLVRSWADEYE